MERATQTKQQLADSLKDLMKNIPFRKITVQNVTDHCGLNRQTFYYHFKDIYQLLEWIYRNEIFPQSDRTDDLDWKKEMRSAIRYALKNKAFLRNINRSIRRETVEKFLYPIIYQWVTLIAADTHCDLSSKPEEQQFLYDFFTNAFVSFLIRWIGNGMQEDEENLLNKVTLIRSMFYSLNLTEIVPGQQTGNKTEPGTIDFLQSYASKRQMELY